MKLFQYCLSVSLFLISLISVAWGQEVSHVLLLNSYHYGLSWTDDETKGVQEVLDKSGRPIELNVEYMDTKRLSDETHFNNIRQLLQYKYRNTHFSSILVTDNDAFDFLRKYRNDHIFAGVPVIIAGVNYYHKEMLAGLSGFTGVAETFEGGQTIEAMKRLHPGVKRIVVIIDGTITGESIRKDLEPMLNPFTGKINFEFWDKVSLEKLRVRLPKLDKDTLVLLMPFVRDSTGTFIRYSDLAKMVSELSSVPVYGTYEFYMGFGIVGGRLTSGIAQGRAAADILLRVLNGEDPDKIPVVTVAPSEFQFDSRQLHRYGIAVSELPAGSLVLYQSWNERYSVYVWLGGLLFTIALLSGWGWRRVYLQKRLIDKALRESHQQILTLLNSMAEGAYGVDTKGNCTFVNQSFLQILGYERPDEIIGKHTHELIHHSYSDGSPYPASECKMYKAFHQNQKNHITDEVLWKKDGSAVPVEYWSQPIEVDNVIQGAIATFIDITERLETEAQIKKSLSLLQATLESTADAILVVDLNNKWGLHNQQFIDLWNIPDEIIAAKDDNAALTYVLQHLEDPEGFLNKVLELYGSPKAHSFDTLKFKDGRIIERFSIPQLLDGVVVGRVWSFRDVTDRKAMEEQVHQLAFYDTLTQLPNRRLLNDRLSQTMAYSKRTGLYCALMFLDLDNFKPLNDTHGHVAGDLLLIEVANRLKNCVRRVDTIARFGGDEFVVILNELGANKTEATIQAHIVAEKIRSSLAEPYSLTFNRDGEVEKQITHRCTTCIGVAVFLNQEGSENEIMKWADTAMYQAKEEGKNLIRFFDPQLGSDITPVEQNSNILRLSWHKSYECGESNIDQEHRKLFELANALIDAAFARDQNPQKFDTAIKLMLDHMVQHFADEEAILARYHYTDLEDHVRAHQLLTVHALKLRNVAVAGGGSIGELVNFVADEVVAQHMIKEDRKFYPLFNSIRHP